MILNIFFTNKPKTEQFFPRKIKLPKQGSFHLYGARGTGKTALIIDYLNSLKDKYLYIDCQDPIFILEDIDSIEIETFIKEEGINTVVLDHYFEGFLDTLPKASQLIVISRHEQNVPLPKYELMPLDFEEFINFKKGSDAPSIFSLYTKSGSLPRVAKSGSSMLSCREIFFEKFDTQEGKVIMVLALFQAKTATSHQIYQRAKEYFKISKDWIYKTIKNYENEKLLFQIPLHQSGIGKKIFLYDFVLSRYLNKHQTFSVTFDSIVALALIKNRLTPKASISPLGYFINSSFIQISPFESEVDIWQKIHSNFSFYTQNGIKEVTIVTVNISYSFKIKNINFRALPFYEWIIELS